MINSPYVAARFADLRRMISYVATVIERIRDAIAPRRYEPSSLVRADVLVAFGMAVLAAFISWSGFQAFDPRINDFWNIYFHADPNRVLLDMTDRFSSQWRSAVHPIFPIMTFPIVRAFMWLGMDKSAIAQALVVLCAAGSGALFFLSMRGLGLSMLAAIAFSGAFLASATFIHWFAFIETYAFSAFALVVTLFMLTTFRTAWLWLWLWVIGSIAALSVTLTNWALALAGGFFRLSFENFVKVTAIAFLVVAAVAGVQKTVFPSSRLFFDPYALAHERHATQGQLLGIWTPAANIRSVLVKSAIAPPPYIDDSPTAVGIYTLVNNQHTAFKDIAPVGVAAVACWLFLLATGIWGAVRESSLRPLTIPLALYMLSQLALWTIFGEITFLYSANFFPALLALAAIGYFTPARRLTVAAALAFTVLAGINNWTEFRSATSLANSIVAHLSVAGGSQCVPSCYLGQ